MSTVFIGTSDFAAAVLQALAQSGGDTRPVLVITRPDRPRGRGRKLASPPVADRARALDIPLEQPQNVNDADARALIARALGATLAVDATDSTGTAGLASATAARGVDTVVVCAFGALIKEPLLSEHELLNVHPSLLPRWRGAAPIERAIMAGDPRTGVSIMRLTAGLDSGPVCLAGVKPIHPDDSYGSLAARLQQLGGELLLRALRERPPFVEQTNEGITYAERLGPEDRLLDPSRPAAELERVVRALQPHIGARVALADGTLLGVHRAALLDDGDPNGDPDGAPGDDAPGVSDCAPSVGVRDGRMLLHCTPGVLELLVVQPPGGRAMTAVDYVRGHPSPGRR